MDGANPNLGGPDRDGAEAYGLNCSMSSSIQKTDLIGVILAGGQSTRMGIDKRSLVLHGVPQLEHMFSLLRSMGLHVVTSCRPADPVPDHFHPMTDSTRVAGPFAGIMTALKEHAGKGVLTFPVDMPHIGPETIEELIEHRDAERMATCFLNPMTGRAEPLLTIWEPGSLEAMIHWTEAGNSSPLDFLQAHPVKMVAASDSRWFLNLNTPEDLARFREATEP